MLTRIIRMPAAPLSPEKIAEMQTIFRLMPPHREDGAVSVPSAELIAETYADFLAQSTDRDAEGGEPC